MNHPIDVALISGRRPELLQRTLASFQQHLFQFFEIANFRVNLDAFGGNKDEHSQCKEIILNHFPNAKINEPKEPGFGKAVQQLREHNIQVFILKQVPWQKGNVPKNLVNAIRFQGDPDLIGISIEDHLNEQQSTNDFLDSLAGTGVKVLDPLALLSHHGRTLTSDGDTPLYRDADHLSIAGSIRLHPLFEPIFKESSKP